MFQTMFLGVLLLLNFYAFGGHSTAVSGQSIHASDQTVAQQKTDGEADYPPPPPPPPPKG